MEPLETLQALELALHIIEKLEDLSLDDTIKIQIKQKVLEIIDDLSKPKKRVMGSQQKIIDSLRKLGGKALRSEIAEDTELDPNVVSSLLSKLVKAKKVGKISIDKPGDDGDRTGRGLEPGYVYVLVEEKKKMKVKELVEALQNCHPDAEIHFCVNFDPDEGGLVAVEYEVNWKHDRGETNPIGTVYLHNTKDDFVHDIPLLEGNFFVT